MTVNQPYQAKLLARHFFDILPMAYQIEKELEPYLKPYQKGIYSRISGRLLMPSYTHKVWNESPYYYLDSSGRSLHWLDKSSRPAFCPIDQTIRTVADLTVPVYDKDFNLVITEQMLADTDTFLSNAPTAPVHGLGIIAGFLEYAIQVSRLYETEKALLWFYIGDYIGLHQDEAHERIVRRNDGRKNRAFLVPSAMEIIERALEQSCSLLLGLIYGANEWSSMEIKRNRHHITLFIYEDYRIVQWMQEHNFDRNGEKQSSSNTNCEYSDIADVVQSLRRNRR